MVEADVRIPDLTKAGTSIRLQIHAEGEKIGEMVLGRGSMTWYGGKWRKGKRISWSEFAEGMDSWLHGRRRVTAREAVPDSDASS